MSERYEGVLKDLERELGYSIKDLKSIRNSIVNRYKRQYAIDVSNLYLKIKNMKRFYTLTERCFKREYDIKTLNYNEYRDDILDAKFLFLIIKEILPFEILYGIDLELVDNIFLDEDEQKVYDYLCLLANIYLEKTAKLKEFILEKNVKILKKIK